MSEDTPKKPRAGGEELSERPENVDPTVQISKAELAAIRQSGSQPSFSRESLASVNRWRDSDESRQRAPTPQYAHPSVGEQEDANSDPTRSFDRARIDAMLQSHHPALEAEELAVQPEGDARLTDAALAAALVAQSLEDASAQPSQQTPHDPLSEDGEIREPRHEDALEQQHEDVLKPQHEDAGEARHEDALEPEEDLSFLDDGIFREIVFGEPESPETSAPPNESELAEPPAQPQATLEATSPETQPTPAEHAPADDLSLSKIDPPESSADELEHEVPAPDALEEFDLDASPPKKRHPLVVLCGVLGMLGICAAILGLAMPDAALSMSPLVHALVLAAGALLVYISIILRP